MLAERLGVPHIATGDLLREAVRKRTTLGKQAHDYMARGNLVPDEIVLKVMLERLCKPDARQGFVLDGFPRNLAQAEALTRLLDPSGRWLDKAVALDVPDEEVVKRISGRRTCRNCAAMYHTIFDPPRNIGVCNECNGELYQRDDDAEDTVRMRLEVYAESTQPLLEHYQREGLLVRVNGVGQPDEVAQRILTGLGVSEQAESGQMRAKGSA